MVKESSRILVTGAKGFIGKNLVAELKNRKFSQIYEYDTDNDLKDLDNFTRDCDLVFHLAGVNRPKEEREFTEGNLDFTSQLTELLKKNNNKSPIIFSSSSQAALENLYGKSKKAAEDLLCQYSFDTGSPVKILRLPNVYGKWCRPSYNSVVATFCHNIANGLPISINNPDSIIKLIYIDDVINELLKLSDSSNRIKGCELIDDFNNLSTLSLFHLSSFLQSYRDSRELKSIPDLKDPLTKKLYATYLSYLPPEEFCYPLKMNSDHRGSFTEFIKTHERGQVSVNISKPGIVKGNHWHHTKNEKFLVVSGSGIIRFRKVNSSEIFEYKVSGDKLEVLDIPPGYAHNIENVGTNDMVTVMWTSEEFDAEKPDTYYEEV